MKDVGEELRSRNLKATPQRIAVLSALQNTDKHPGAEQIYNSLKTDFPYISFATIYKTLDSFVKAGLIQELNMGEGSFRYDANNEPHPHLICLACTEVSDLPSLLSMDSLRAEASRLTDFNIIREQIYFYGTCGNCSIIQEEKNEQS